MQNLNMFLDNYPRDQVIVIYGEPASGKTTLSLQLVLDVLRKNKKVIFIDCEKGFSLDRLKQMDENVESYLKNLIVFTPKSFKEQIDIINKLSFNVGLVVLDSLSKFYRVELKNNHALANESTITQLRKLHKFIDRKIPVVITNQVYSSMDKSIQLVGGGMLRRWSQFLIKLNKDPRKFILEKPKNKEFSFKIVDKGLIDV